MSRYLIRAVLALLALLLLAFPVGADPVYDVSWSTEYDYAGVTSSLGGTGTATLTGSFALFRPWSVSFTDPVQGSFTASGLGGPGQFITLGDWPVPSPSALIEHGGTSGTTFDGPADAPASFTLLLRRVGRLEFSLADTGSELFSALGVLHTADAGAAAPEPSTIVLALAGLTLAAFAGRSGRR